MYAKSPPNSRPAWAVLAVVLLSSCWATSVSAAESLDGAAQVQGDRFDGQRAYEYLKQVCDIGPRVSGTEGMLKQQSLLLKHFQKLGGKAWLQKFSYRRHPLTKRRVRLANLIVEWRPEAEERILLCAHYDTRPYPDRDPNPNLLKAAFLGANDGGSGVAALMELGHHVDEMPAALGLDFVFFDAEELVYNDRTDKYFLGSTWFAEQYKRNPPPYRYQAGVLLDMVGDKDLSVFQETRSATMPSTRPIVKEVWSTAARLGVKEFIPSARYEVNDDHVPLNNIAKIPTINVIDFNYPDRWNRFWHTTQDTPARCSAESLGKVGWVIQNWLHDRLAGKQPAAAAGE